MGCSASKKDETPRTPEVRRRLSIGDIGPIPKNAINYTGSEEDRAMLVELNKQQVLSLTGRDKDGDDDTFGKKFSIGTETDATMNRVPSFKQKTVESTGRKFDPSKDCIGYACMKGKKPESPNQDSFFIMKVEGDFCIYGVFDGHGHKGHDVSNFIKNNLPKILLQHPQLQEDPLDALTKSFTKMQNMIVHATEQNIIDAVQSGSTVSVIYHDLKKNLLHVAHVGDSRCVLGRMDMEANEDDRWKNHDLTVDHKPNDPEERARIQAAGGRVVWDGGWNHRVYAKNHRGPGLNMSRAMGDLIGFYHAGISPVPDVNTKEVQDGSPKKGQQLEQEEIAIIQDPMVQVKSTGSNNSSADKTASGEGKPRPSNISSASPSVSSYVVDPNVDRFVLLCSDGVWEFISSEEAVKICAPFKAEDAMKAAEHLAKISWDRWIKNLAGQVVDDITVVLVNLTYVPENCQV